MTGVLVREEIQTQRHTQGGDREMLCEDWIDAAKAKDIWGYQGPERQGSSPTGSGGSLALPTP